MRHCRPISYGQLVILTLLIVATSEPRAVQAQNQPPQLVTPIPDVFLPGLGSEHHEYNIHDFFSDPEGDPLVWLVRSNDTDIVIVGWGQDGTIDLLAPFAPFGREGTTTVEVLVTDQLHPEITEIFNVTVGGGGVVPSHVVKVTNTSDAVNGTTSSIADLNTSDGGDGISLREAILAANATPNDAVLDSIHFNIPGVGPHTIQPLSQLPDITDPVVIDGYTQPGSSPNTNGWGMGLNTVLMVELDGSLAGSGATGLFVRETPSCVIRGMVVNGFDGYGFHLYGSLTVGSRIEGNLVGTDPTGTMARPNGQAGIRTSGLQSVIGGNVPEARNLASGNGVGVQDNGYDTRTLGNLIGTDITGTIALGNNLGVYATGGHGVIGEPGAGNVISGNIYGALNGYGPDKLVQGNYIGPDVTGGSALGNGNDHNLRLSRTGLIGGTEPGAGNVILGSIFSDGSGPLTIQGNYIGTDATGSIMLANGGTIQFQGSSGHLVGGPTASARNVIAGTGYGITLGVGSNTIIQGNYIGTDVTGTKDFGGTGWAIRAVGNSGPSTDHVIGGLGPGEGNLIAGYSGGVLLEYAGVTGTRVQGNLIGTAADGVTPIAMNYGVAVWRGASQTLIEQNTIANAVYYGVQVDANSTQITIRSNRIHNSGELGIELTEPGTLGVTANDDGDVDSGGNDLQNYPVITAAVRGATNTSIQGTLNSSPNASFTVELFANSSAHSSGYGEGELPLGTTMVNTDASGNGAFSVSFDPVASSMTHITATATDADGNTSEFSAAVALISNTAPVALAGGPYSGDEGSAIGLDGASATDADGDTLNLNWTVDNAVCSFSDPSAQNPTLSCLDNGTFEVTLAVDDGSGAVESSAQVTVANVVPTIGIVSGPLDPVQVDSVVTGVSTDFSDPAGSNDAPYTCAVDYGDGSGPLAGSVTDWACTGPPHAFASAGVFAVEIKVTDKDGGQSAPSLFQFVVVYDPGAGFVSGAGLIDSPPGAFAADPALSGKARFGFVSKYQKGASTPSGQTIFKFNVADLSFESDVYEWLVVAGANAKFKGTGSINDEGNFGFMITATDEKLTPATDTDLFRIKIWDKEAGDAVTYDNQMGDSDDADAATPIVGGNIVIHTTGNGAAAKSDAAALGSDVPADYVLAQNYPNPFNPSTRIEYALPEKAFVRLTVFDALGRMVAGLVNQEVPAGRHSTQWNAGGLGSGVYFYRFEAGDFVAVRTMFLAQ